MDELITTIQYIVNKSNELKDTFPETIAATVEFACIFCQSDEEYKKYTSLIIPLGRIVEDTKNGYTYLLKEPIRTSSGLLSLVKIRKPDSLRKERGDADFNTNYRKLKEKYVDDPRFELIKRDAFEMLRLSKPNFDVMVCFSNIPKSKGLAIETKKITCFSCWALVPDIEGPVHPYLVSAPGCWKIYGEILAKEYTLGNYDPILHRITVDAYAVQHPGVPEKRTINSANFHLIRLFFIYEKKLDSSRANAVMKKISESKELHTQFKWLDPPSFKDTVNVSDLAQAKDLESHKKIVKQWGLSVWNVWKEKHGSVIEKLADQVY